jgi:competence protein ComEA
MLLSLFVAMFMAGGFAWAGDAVNINTASAKQLQKVDGIGAKTAAKIVAYREEHGAFKNVEGLLKIKGFGKKKLEKSNDELTVDDAGNREGSDEH